MTLVILDNGLYQRKSRMVCEKWQHDICQQLLNNTLPLLHITITNYFICQAMVKKVKNTGWKAVGCLSILKMEDDLSSFIHQKINNTSSEKTSFTLRV